MVSILTSSVALGGQMSFSVYHDSWSSGSGLMLTGYTNVIDNSSGCSHSGYSTTLQITSPSYRTASNQVSGMSATASIALNDESGTYVLITTGTVYCGCSGYTIGYGGADWFDVAIALATTYYTTPSYIGPGCLYNVRIKNPGVTCLCGQQTNFVLAFTYPCPAKARCQWLWVKITAHGVILQEDCFIAGCWPSSTVESCTPVP